jgi:hypothetical protein
MMRRPLACLAALLLAAAPARALHGGDERLFKCERGDCQNGQGGARSYLTSVLFEGSWRGGHTVPGESYRLSHPVKPGSHWKAVYADNGLQDSGDMLFGLGLRGRALPVFSGSFAHVEHPFARMRVAVPRRGQLDDGNGYLYQGRFEYLPARNTMNSNLVEGTYIFFGTVVDTEENRRETGLWVSNVQPNGLAPMFHKADPGFLMAMQRRHQKDLQIADVEFAERAERQRWMDALAVVGRITMTLASGGVSAARRELVTEVAGEVTMNLLGAVLAKPAAGQSVADATKQAIQKTAGGDEGLAELLRELVKP